MYVLENYDFLEKLVKNGQAKQEPFYRDGFCLVNKIKNPNHVLVFKFDNDVIWIYYAYTDKKNKSFYKFVQLATKIMFSFGMPLLRMGKNQDFKNHTVHIGFIDDIAVYQYLGVNMGGGGSSSKNITNNYTTLKPTTNLTFDTEELAKAIYDSSNKQMQADMLNAQLQKAGLQIEAAKAQAEIDLKEKEFNLNVLSEQKFQKGLLVAAALLAGTYVYQKYYKKGKKKK